MTAPRDPHQAPSVESREEAAMRADADRVEEHALLPRLRRDPAFWGMSVTQFLGAFNDNMFKQVLLLLFVAVPWGGETRDLQWLGTLAFSAPFIFFSGLAGYLSDRFSKRPVIIACKLAEVAIMLLGAGLFALYAARDEMTSPLLLAFCGALFFMGAQSAFFGPGKYGILPEMLRERDLPIANGCILMLTFLSIILGAASAGFLKEWTAGELWMAGLACTAIAITGVMTALPIRRLAPARRNLQFTTDALWIPSDVRAMLAADRPLLAALAVAVVFWTCAAMVQMAVNALGKLQLAVGDARTSLLVSLISVGIAIGSVIAGAASRGRFHTGLLRLGLWGLIGCLVLLALPGPGGHLLGYAGSAAALIALGVFTGLFAVPLQVFVQMRPPREQKGRMIATQNLLSWMGITLSALVYFGFNRLLAWLQWPASGMFGLTAAMLLVVALLYHPKSEKLHE